MLRTSGVMSLKTRQKSFTVLQGRHLGAGAFTPNFCREDFLEKVIEKEHFGVILWILLVKPPSPRRQKMSIAVIVKRRFYMITRWFAMEDYVRKGVNFKFVWSWT